MLLPAANELIVVLSLVEKAVSFMITGLFNLLLQNKQRLISQDKVTE